MIILKKTSTKIIVGLASIACIAGFSGYNRYVENKEKITSDKTLSTADQNSWSGKKLSLILDEQHSGKNAVSSVTKTQEELVPEKETTNLTSPSNFIPTPDQNVAPANNENTKNNMSNTTTNSSPAAEITQTVVSNQTTPVVALEKKKNTKTRAS